VIPFGFRLLAFGLRKSHYRVVSEVLNETGSKPNWYDSTLVKLNFYVFWNISDSRCDGEQK
jgi:hypothetical protein